MDRVLRAKADSVRSVIDAERDKLERLISMSDMMRKERNIMVYEVELKKIPAVKVLSLRGVIPHYNQEGLLWERLGRFVNENKIKCHRDGFSTYFDEEYKEADPDVEIAIPVDKLGESMGDFIYREYDEIPLAATVRFSGPYDGGYDAACGELAQWIEKNGYAFDGNLRGHVIVSPDENPNPESWETELQVPVVKR
jgi:effector-binding domain-containing protein